MRLFFPAIRFALAFGFAGALALASAHRDVRAEARLPEPFDPGAIDRSANVCTNFFEYATGTWRKAHPIPAAYSEFGYIEVLVDRTREIVRDTLTSAQAHPGPRGGVAQKIGSFYGACMDVAAVERAGLRPIAPELARIAALRSRAQLAAELAHLHVLGVDAGFFLGPTQDFKNSNSVIAEIDQAGIGLPERDYYLRSDADSRKLRAKYVAHVAKMLALSEDVRATADANAIMAFETALARASTPAATLRDPAAVYHPMRAPAVEALAPHVAFARYWHDAGVPTAGTMNVAEPAFVRTLDAQVARAPIATWRAYLRWRVLDSYAPMLPKRFDDENFAFRGRILNGTKEQLPRWKRCVEATNEYLGEAVGQAYVAKQFSPAAKQVAMNMVLRIRAAYRAEMAALPWMSAATKQVAIAKLDAMGLKVGYPDRWRSYAGYDVAADAYLANVEGGRAFDHRYQIGKIGKPLNKAEWSMTPQTVNAYNDTQRNEIVLPAAQLQLPFFDPNGDDAANLAATGGGTVGHEMTHGFDDQGHKFDLHGNVRNWWTPQDLRAFDSRAQCVIDQFSNTVAVGTVHYQGKLVAGEAIADLGGVVIGYRALEHSLIGKPHDAVDGFTPEQRYFLAFAQSWTENVRPEAERTEALTDPTRSRATG